MALKYYAPHKRVVKLDKLIPFNQFKSLLTGIGQCECMGFLWIDIVPYYVDVLGLFAV